MFASLSCYSLCFAWQRFAALRLALVCFVVFFASRRFAWHRLASLRFPSLRFRSSCFPCLLRLDRRQNVHNLLVRPLLHFASLCVASLVLHFDLICVAVLCLASLSCSLLRDTLLSLPLLHLASLWFPPDVREHCFRQLRLRLRRCSVQCFASTRFASHWSSCVVSLCIASRRVASCLLRVALLFGHLSLLPRASIRFDSLGFASFWLVALLCLVSPCILVPTEAMPFYRQSCALWH